VSLQWKAGSLTQATITSTSGNVCRVRTPQSLAVTSRGKAITVTRPDTNVIEFRTMPGATYVVSVVGARTH
jgi:hypothetical protein